MTLSELKTKLLVWKSWFLTQKWYILDFSSFQTQTQKRIFLVYLNWPSTENWDTRKTTKVCLQFSVELNVCKIESNQVQVFNIESRMLFEIMLKRILSDFKCLKDLVKNLKRVGKEIKRPSFLWHISKTVSFMVAKYCRLYICSAIFGVFQIEKKKWFLWRLKCLGWVIFGWKSG